MSRETVTTPRGPLHLEPHPATASIKVTWSASSRVGEIAVPVLTELDATWHAKSKAWYLAPVAIDELRARLSGTQ